MTVVNMLVSCWSATTWLACAGESGEGSGVKPAGVTAVGGVTAGAGSSLGRIGKSGGTVGIMAGDGVGSTLVTVAKMLEDSRSCEIGNVSATDER